MYKILYCYQTTGLEHGRGPRVFCRHRLYTRYSTATRQLTPRCWQTSRAVILTVTGLEHERGSEFGKFPSIVTSLQIDLGLNIISTHLHVRVKRSTDTRTVWGPKVIGIVAHHLGKSCYIPANRMNTHKHLFLFIETILTLLSINATGL